MLTLTRHGQTLHFDDSGFRVMPYVYRPLLTGGIYEEGFLEYIRSRAKVGQYVDVGAHLGTHTLWFARMCPATQVHAFEPVSRYASILRRNVTANSLEDKITVHQMGLASRAGQATNYMSNEHQLGFAEGNAAGVTETFGVSRLDDIVRGPIALIKLDVEGMEAEALRGATRILSESRPLIFAEAQKRAAFDDIVRALAPFGYRPTGRSFNATPTYEFSTDLADRRAFGRLPYTRLLPMLHYGRRVWQVLSRLRLARAQRGSRSPKVGR